MFISQCAPDPDTIRVRGAENSAEYLPKMNEKESCLENRDSSLFLAEITRTKLRIQFAKRIMSATIIKLAKNEKLADFIIDVASQRMYTYNHKYGKIDYILPIL